MIPDEAVEAAARYTWDKNNAPIPWTQATKKARAVYLEDARWALEGAESLLKAEAWDEGEQAGAMNHAAEEYPEVKDIHNPYRSQA